MKLALGTVQFGADYGAFNSLGRPATGEVVRILDSAHASGVRTLDTARAYGESEAVLGELGAAERFSIVTKVPSLAGAPRDAVRKSVEASLAALHAEKVYALMLHSAADLLGADGDSNWQALDVLRDRGLCRRAGVSVYRPEEARAIIERYPVDILQLPANILDQRFARAGILDLCKARDIEIHVRSVFLQGFLLAAPDMLSGSLRAYRAVLERVIDCAMSRGIPRSALALGPMLADERISAVLVGVDSLTQLDEILAAARLGAGVNAFDELAIGDESLLNPALWTN